MVAAHRLPLVVVNGACSLVAMSGLLIAVASLAMEHRLRGAWALVAVAQGRQRTESVAVAHGLSCPVAYGVFLDQGSNPCFLHWKVDS